MTKSERSASFPNYHISRMTPSLADPAAWRLEVAGLVRTPLVLSLEEIRQLGRLTYTVKHHCVEGWSAIATWTGLPFRAIAERAGVDPQARFVRFDSFDVSVYQLHHADPTAFDKPALLEGWEKTKLGGVHE